MSALRNRVIAVTGAAKRIGRSIAVELASRGASVAVHYHESRREAVDTAKECSGQAFRANLASVDQIRHLFEEIRSTYGRLDGLVNNAAVFRRTDPLKVTESDWDLIHDVNLKAVFFCCQQAAQIMRLHGRGRIVNITSLGGIRPWAKHVPYCASKAGAIMLTRSLAKALAPYVSVNAVAPGVIHFGDDMPPDIAHLVRITPQGRHGTGEDVARVVRMLLEGPSFVTGQIIAVDGGLSLK